MRPIVDRDAPILRHQKAARRLFERKPRADDEARDERVFGVGFDPQPGLGPGERDRLCRRRRQQNERHWNLDDFALQARMKTRFVLAAASLASAVHPAAAVVGPS